VDVDVDVDVIDTENMSQTLDSFYACCWCLMPVPQLCVWHTTGGLTLAPLVLPP
jgi:hypothetical protein